MSLYPDISTEDAHTPDDWEAMNNDCIANMKALIAKYNTPVMMCEIGISWDYEEAEAFYTDFVTNVWEYLPGNLNVTVTGKVIVKGCSMTVANPPIHLMLLRDK